MPLLGVLSFPLTGFCTPFQQIQRRAVCLFRKVFAGLSTPCTSNQTIRLWPAVWSAHVLPHIWIWQSCLLVHLSLTCPSPYSFSGQGVAGGGASPGTLLLFIIRPCFYYHFAKLFCSLGCNIPLWQSGSYCSLLNVFWPKLPFPGTKLPSQAALRSPGLLF